MDSNQWNPWIPGSPWNPWNPWIWLPWSPWMSWNQWIPIKLCSHFGYCRRRLFSPEKGGPRFFEHVQLEKFVCFKVLVVYLAFSYLDIAAGAFFPGKSAILDFYALCNMPQALFFPEKVRSWIFAPALSNFKLNVHRLRCLSTKSSLLEHAAGAAGAAGAVEVVSRTRLGAHLPHAPGARMTVVTQTPSNHGDLGR